MHIPADEVLSPWEKWMIKKTQEELERIERLRKEKVCSFACVYPPALLSFGYVLIVGSSGGFNILSSVHSRT
jgi:hypothetical protein